MRKAVQIFFVLLLISTLTACSSDNKNTAINDKPTEIKNEEQVPTDKKSTAEINAKLKAKLETYEAFFDKYVEFMKKFKSAEDTSGMLIEYADYMAKYAENILKLESINKKELTKEEREYYQEVFNRIMKKIKTINQADK